MFNSKRLEYLFYLHPICCLAVGRRPSTKSYDVIGALSSSGTSRSKDESKEDQARDKRDADNVW
jgi:hypothetical protein